MGNRVVYQPAYEAEVEYLESTGTQWIDTGVKPDNTYTFDCEVAVTQDNYNCVYWGTRNSGDFESENSQCYLNSNSTHFLDRYHEINLYSTTAGAPSNWHSNVTPSVNTMYELTGMTVVPTMNSMIYPIALFAFNNIGNVNAEAGKCRIGYWKCYSNGHVVRDFIPVRIGTTGYMYDKVTKQLFANAGTGNFILGNDVVNATIPKVRNVIYLGGQRCIAYEKLYERKEWLQGRNGAYIDTNYYPIVGTDIFSVHFHYDGTLRNPDGTEQDAFGATLSSGCRLSAYINGDNYLSCNYCRIQNNYFPSTAKHSLDWNISNLRVDGENFKYDANNDSYSFSNKEISIVTGSKTLYVFSCNQGSSTYLHGDISSFKITDTSSNTKLDLIPCTLSVDLPAYMDANNIPRTKGTSGMWDKVSGRFFGNVASNGTFKAVNLAEGVDYEVYDWLKTEVVGEEVRMMMQLPIHSYSFSFSRKIISGTNVPYFYTEGGAPINAYINTTNLHTIIIWNNVQGSYYKSGQSFDRNDAISIVSSTDGLVVNSQTIPQNTFPARAIFFGANDNNGTENYTSSIYVDGLERYIPVKLLRSIPSKYDANGIARNANECGMYDTVNDVFYGNVASSGTFTVSND